MKLMKLISAILVLVAFTSLVWLSSAFSSKNPGHLFSIERSTNRNVVHYDAALTEDNGLLWPNPVSTYWIMEDGSRQELNSVEKRYAYGISSPAKIDLNKLTFHLAALKGRSITVEKIDGSFRAVVQIGGKRSVVKRVYIQTESTRFGFPKVTYLDLFGTDLSTNMPVKERISRAEIKREP
jgi:hypothetical protein